MTPPTARQIYRSGWKELVFQATYAVRSGNPVPEGDPRQFSRKARQRVALSQGAASLFMALIVLGGVALLSGSLETLVAGAALPRVLYITCVLGGLFIVQLGLLWWLGLQFLPTYLSSAIIPVLRTLPLPTRTVDRVALLLLVRLFDAPALTCLLLTPLAVGLALGSWVAALATIPAELTVVVLAMAFAVATGRFFVRNVLGSPGGHRATAMRWGYLVLWGLPAFALFGFIALASRFLAFVLGLWLNGPTAALTALLATYPFNFALLPALAGTGSSVPVPDGLAGVLGVAALYAVPVALAGRWLLTAPGRLAALTTAGHARPEGPRPVQVRSPPRAIVTKDLRLASRTPAFAFLILIPLGDATLLGLATAFSPSPIVQANPAALAEAAVASAALLATFFGPAFFAIEVMSYSYSRSLPLSARSLLVGKTTLILLLYTLAASVVLLLTLTRYFLPLEFGAFLLAEVPAVCAAALLQLGILLAVARRRGLPLVNLYTGAFWLFAVSIPGLLIAGTPLALYAILAGTSIVLALGVMGAVAVLELAAVLPLTIGRFRGAAT